MGSSAVPACAAGDHNPIVTSSAKEAVLVANTPSFLLDRLRKDDAVRFVLDKMKPSEIVAALQEGLASPPPDAVALVPLYVYLAALSSTDPSDRETWNKIRALDLSHLEWGEAIRNIVLASAVPTTTSTLDFTLAPPPKP
jgi:hypothetical protein